MENGNFSSFIFYLLYGTAEFQYDTSSIPPQENHLLKLFVNIPICLRFLLGETHVDSVSTVQLVNNPLSAQIPLAACTKQ